MMYCQFLLMPYPVFSFLKLCVISSAPLWASIGSKKGLLNEVITGCNGLSFMFLNCLVGLDLVSWLGLKFLYLLNNVEEL